MAAPQTGEVDRRDRKGGEKLYMKFTNVSQVGRAETCAPRLLRLAGSLWPQAAAGRSVVRSLCAGRPLSLNDLRLAKHM